jgi:predicted ATP-dependent protease
MDWVYVNNFEAPHKPIAIQLPAGSAKDLAHRMDLLIDELANDIPALFESEDYQTRRRAIEERFSEAHETAMGAVFEHARENGVAILRTPMGFSFAGFVDGEVMTKEQYDALSEDDRAKLETAMEAVQKELSEALKAVPKREKDHRRAVEKLNYAMATQGVDDAIREVKEAFAGQEAVQSYLDRLRADLIENAVLFLIREEGAEAGPFPLATSRFYERPQFQRYRVNVLVSGDADTEAAPVVAEDMPTLGNLIGRIEYASEMGNLVTNFTMIKSGALHRANGGYLVLDVRQVLSEPLAWDALKRSLRSREISIYSPGERLSLVSTVSLNPDPVPLDVRVVLIGERMHYYLLSALDPEFPQLFKLQADFNDHLSHDGETVPDSYLAFIAGLAQEAGTRALDKDAVLRLLQESVRLAGDAERLTLNTGRLSDILREADFWADAKKADQIGAEQVEQAVVAREDRASRLRDLSQEAIHHGTIMIDTEGARIGQINALSVLQIGGTAFGRPSRLTARVRSGTGKVVDIEREAELGGPIHSKGMLILQGYLATHFATDAPISLWASLVFEQSYGGVDGDSASAAELIALLSALAEAPIEQSFAITGSINQFGDVQAIGGVNEKIEGFFDICAERGLTGKQGVLIPAANVRNLALRRRVIEAVEADKFRIFPMTSLADGIAVLTGLPAGALGDDGIYPEGSVNRRVDDRLKAFAEIRKAFAKGMRNDES